MVSFSASFWHERNLIVMHFSRFHYSPSACGANSCFASDDWIRNGALSNADEFASHEDEDVIYDATYAPDYVSGPISLEDPERVILGASLSKAP
jgi:hypothetical protein